jgi:hypothetical protein
VEDSGGRAAAVAGEGRIELSLPLARRLALARAVSGPPVLHIVEPLVRASGVIARGGGDAEALAGSPIAPLFAQGLASGPDPRTISAGLLAAGLRTSIGAMAGGIAPGRDPWIGKIGAELSFGALFSPDRRDSIAAGELTVETRDSSGGGFAVGLQGAAARSILPASELVVPRDIAWLGLGRVRYDTSREGLRVELRGAVRGELPVIAARAILGAEVAPRLATATGLATPGSTLGLGAGFPIGFGVRIGGDVDVFGDTLRDVFRKDESRLLDVHGTLRYRHPCGCFRFGLRGGHVVGREGIDVFASLDLARFDPADSRDW